MRGVSQILTSEPPREWIVDRVIVLDWYDGIRGGVVRMKSPPREFSFELFDERYNPEGLDDRLFSIQGIEVGSINRMLAAIHILGVPDERVWIPVWKFPSNLEQQHAEGVVRGILSKRVPTQLIVNTRDMLTFENCWQIANQSDDPDSTWFERLGIE